MIAVVCVDDRGGMLFNRRRQSQDRVLRGDLLAQAAGRPVWMNGYSLGQFGPETGDLRTAEDCLDRAGKGELCFVETTDPAPWLERMEGLVLYRWNRRYPADLRFTLPLEGWTPVRREEFAGSSHEKITKEVYKR